MIALERDFFDLLEICSKPEILYLSVPWGSWTPGPSRKRAPGFKGCPKSSIFHVFFGICVFDIFTKKYEPDWVESDWTRLGMDLNRIEPDWVGIGTGSNRIGLFGQD